MSSRARMCDSTASLPRASVARCTVAALLKIILGATLILSMSAPLLSVGGAAKLPMILGAHSALHLLYRWGISRTQTSSSDDMIVVRIFARVTPTRKFWRFGHIEPASVLGDTRKGRFSSWSKRPLPPLFHCDACPSITSWTQDVSCQKWLRFRNMYCTMLAALSGGVEKAWVSLRQVNASSHPPYFSS